MHQKYSEINNLSKESSCQMKPENKYFYFMALYSNFFVLKQACIAYEIFFFEIFRFFPNSFSNLFSKYLLIILGDKITK